MRITARVVSAPGLHEVHVATNGAAKSVGVAPRSDRPGSSVNGGEMLFAALATCYCNDLYREAATTGLRLTRVEVEVTGDFGGRGEPARSISYRAAIDGDASADELDRLLEETDRVAEIQNTVRAGCPVTFAGRMT
jgi:organic hydroperoxide reductase OsmC/OhrA